ncbi:hypothetical protein M3P05_17300 [Sansalvadorimonas sp. 2012CJ34-2]|uniref:Uncharacterized protein n=1 Tax=Parendozoicomonas callyspongiae TaxID=2942213 RepID=A0ABT0PJW5_9GAMM|nr:hypothetical protein [Sansalvadorimonas sp. 2012CJ34-2]MCL6271677.1 hypothetical protein [Sansalvadorimonas sp. 2012CJ34-2]
MPGNSWKDKQSSFEEIADQSGGRNQAGQNKKAPPFGSAGKGFDDMAGLSPKLDALIEQRKELEDTMRNLSSGDESEGGFLKRSYPVASLAERRMEQMTWEKQRADGSSRKQEREARRKSTVQNNSSLGWEQSLRTGLRDFTEPVNNWLNARDRERQGLRDKVRDKLSPLDRASRPVKRAHGQVKDAADQFRQLDKQLEKEGLHKDREEIKNLKAVKAINSADKYLGGVNRALDAPQRNVKKVDDFWKKKDNGIRGAMDRFGPYVERSRKRLSSETGGSGDLFERMKKNRERALAKMREKRQQEARDQKRRERAQQLQKKRQKNKREVDKI